MPDYLRKLHSLLRRLDADMAVCQSVKTELSGWQGERDSPAAESLIEGRMECMREFLSSPLIDTTAWRKLYRTSLFRDTGIRYPVGRLNEDVFTTYRIVVYCRRIAVTMEPLHVYRQRVNSITHSAFMPGHLDGIAGGLERYDYISCHYPELRTLASKGIIYAAGKALQRLAFSENITTKERNEYLARIQPLYKRYLKEYLASNARKGAKIFAVSASFNLPLTLRMLRCLHLGIS